MMKLLNLTAATRLLRLVALLAYVCGVGSAANLNAAGNGRATPVTTNKMKITIGSTTFTAKLAENPTAAAFNAMLPLTVDMADLNRNEKHCQLGRKLRADDANPGTIHAGDVMLWQSNTLVLFYETFRTSYSYTMLGRIDDASALAAAVGDGSVRVTFELEQNGK